MSEITLVNLSLIVLLLPIIGFTVVLLFGKRFFRIFWLEIGALGLAFILASIVLVVKLTTYVDAAPIVFQFTWINFGNLPLLGNLQINLGIKIDNMAAIMMFVVTLISFLVHIYSIGYMHGDKRFTRYYAYLGIFSFSMLGIVITHNLLLMYICWELVGLSSYLLIGFWYEKKSAADAGKKAFLVNRIGDIGMFIGILILFTNYHTFTFDTIFSAIGGGHLPFDSGAWLTATGILLFMGAVGKSAQFPLHVWLPDAMEGPTPVSALIHAATMVAAGVYMIARIFPMLTADALLVIALVGGFTSFLAATIAITQNDIKKVLAYSTISQLGYMVMAMGVGAYAYGFFHLVTHAWFKALLFLGSGSVIQALHHEQDIREMGGLRKKLPITYYTFLTATLAISGVPFFSGFLSKDGLLLGTYAFGSLTGHILIPIFGFTVVILTAFYMFRLVILTFHGKPRNQEKYDHAHESPKVMTIPMIVLAVLSFFFWYSGNPFSAESGWFISKWIHTPHSVVPQAMRFNFMRTGAAASAHFEGAHEVITHSPMYMEALHHAHYPAMIISILFAGLGILLAYLIYQWKKIDADKLAETYSWFYKFSLNKWYFDEFYHATFVAGTIGLGKVLAWFDTYIVDGLVNGAAWLTRQVSAFSGLFDTYVVDGLVNFTAFFSGFIGLGLKKIQTGRVQTYVVFAVFSILILLLILRPF